MGNFLGFTYFILFQLCGIAIATAFFDTEKWRLRLVMGSVSGSVIMQWLPALFSFFFDFSLTSHMVALATVIPAASAAAYFGRKNFLQKPERPRNGFFFVVAAVFGIYVFLVFHGYRVENGEIFSGQSTYGDMSMHLGFITSIKEQGTFPPEYSILPGTLLSYPFLCASISSSVYLLGASLRFAYILPMLFAGAQVIFGLYLFFEQWLKEKKTVITAFIFFFFSGGLGFIYFFPESMENMERFTRIFTGFYTTPTNYTDENLRFVNVIADMMIPQRATLFGWAVLIMAIYALYGAVFCGRDSYFIYSAVLTGALPMIHTHSFLAMGMICIMWLIVFLMKGRAKSDIAAVKLKVIAACALAALYSLSHGIHTLESKEPRVANVLLITAIVSVALCMGFAVYQGVGYMREKSMASLLKTWGIFLAIVMVTALPQLLFWTFRQSGVGEYFLRGHFGWVSTQEDYMWFYIKNIGLTGLLALAGVFYAGPKNLAVISPALLLWWVSQLVVFQPNEYDNNKLMLVAFMLLCAGAAVFAVESIQKFKKTALKRIAATAMIILCTLSAALTLGREAVASYVLYDKIAVDLSEYIKQNIEPKSIFLTGTRHNNEVANLAGRNIVCGSSAYLYFHGVDYIVQESDVEKMYESPQENLELFSRYKVDYILISTYETYDYEVDEDFFRDNFDAIYQDDGLILYRTEGRL